MVMTRKQWNNYSRQKIKEWRIHAYNILGGAKCSICGIDDVDVLVIDHKQPCGKSARPTGTHQIYLEIIKNPKRAKEQYQVLCCNCNQKKKIKNKEWRKVASQTSIPQSRLEKIISSENLT
jgi:hypothetical protein